MKYKNQIAVLFIYGISIFGAIDHITEGIKIFPKTLIVLFSVLAFGGQCILKKRSVALDIGKVFFALISSIGFSLFLSDLLFQPISVAMDCYGHKPSRQHFFDIILIGLLTTSLIGFFFVKTHKQILPIEKILSILFLIIITLCYFQFFAFRKLNDKIDDISKPIYTLPKGC